MGRYLAAKKNLRPGEVIISEKPLVVGPCQDGKAVCLGCYRDIQDLLSPPRCSGCGWPLCRENCSGVGQEYGHSKEECSALAKIPVGERPSRPTDGILYVAVTPLRCLLLKTSAPERWAGLVRMESHDGLRKARPSLWEANTRNVVTRIRDAWGFSHYAPEEIHTVCGYLEVNSFAIGLSGVNIRGLYPTSFLIAHDCVPNTSHIDDESFQMTIRASVPIEKGQAITLSYAQTLQGTMKRRQHLRETKFFDCACARCSDRTELGSQFSALRCRACPRGLLLPQDPLDSASPWTCQASDCPGTLQAQDILTIVTCTEAQLEKLKDETIEDYEEFLKKYEHVFHPNHYLMIGAKLSLSQMYGKLPGYLLHEMNSKQLQRKLEICRHVLKIIDLFEPGLTRIRGISLYELHAPLMVLTMNKSRSGGGGGDAGTRGALREVARLLREAHGILRYEPESSEEASVCLAIKEAIAATDTWRSAIGTF